ncbi:hypothetical protein GCM10023310_51710 [Paenibacillus vulneris]|uniref:Uncharacterized protein n=1 Tax=Paenibacillus vulneris TaxID=1133364 RepID=A0ABW3UJ53_9BACL
MSMNRMQPLAAGMFGWRGAVRCSGLQSMVDSLYHGVLCSTGDGAYPGRAGRGTDGMAVSFSSL